MRRYGNDVQALVKQRDGLYHELAVLVANGASISEEFVRRWRRAHVREKDVFEAENNLRWLFSTNRPRALLRASKVLGGIDLGKQRADRSRNLRVVLLAIHSLLAEQDAHCAFVSTFALSDLTGLEQKTCWRLVGILEDMMLIEVDHDGRGKTLRISSRVLVDDAEVREFAERELDFEMELLRKSLPEPNALLIERNAKLRAARRQAQIEWTAGRVGLKSRQAELCGDTSDTRGEFEA